MVYTLSIKTSQILFYADQLLNDNSFTLVNQTHLIDQYEKTARGYYGGTIGVIGFNGEVNHAIMIRSFLSKQNTLFYQAGAGVVDASVAESELQEVNNKLNALKTAIKVAETL